jgi:tetratricopeptide (TPR) repeat protein
VLGSDAIELIQAMVNRSLLRTERVHGRTRFDMRQLWREFVRQQTASGLLAEARTAHREWYLSACMQAARRAHGPDGQQARQWLMAERANLGMLAAAGAWEPVWALRALLHYGGLPVQFPHWVKQCDGPFAELMRGELALQRGRLSEATVHLERALDAVDDLHRWEVLLNLGIAAVESSGPEGSMKMHSAALEAAQAVGSHRGIGRALGSQGVTLNLLGDPSGARDRYDQAFDALQRAGDTLSLGILTLQIGDLHVQAGRLTEARLSFTSAQTQFRALASTRWLGFTAGRLGAIALENGQAEVAIANCREAVEQLTRVGCLREAEVYRGYVGVARHAAGDLEGALSCYIDAQTRVRSDRHHCAIFASFAAVAAFQLGQSAEYWLKTTETLAEQIQRQDVLVTLALNRAHARARLDPAEANARLLETAGQSIGTDGRIARRWLAAALGQVEREIPDALHVSPDFERFEPPGKARIDIGKRRTLVRIFQALVVERRERPGSGLSLDALQTIGWPGERMSPISGANRVYVAIASLRASGLRDLLLKREVGYLLDPNVRLLIRADSPPVTGSD